MLVISALVVRRSRKNVRSLEDLTAVMLYNGDGGFKIDRNKPKSSGEGVVQGRRK